MKAKLKTAILLFSFLSTPCFGESDWKETTSWPNTGAEIATNLADKLSQSLSEEKSTVVYVNYKKCDLSKKWCEQFERQLENRLIENEISFLPQDKQDLIRKQITNELRRQQTSDLVDLDKVVELGKQESIKAIITITASKETETLFSASAKSINLEKSIITISKVSRIAVRESNSSSTMQGVVAWSAIGIGSVAAMYEWIEHKKYSQEGDDHFKDYSISEDPSEIEALRKKVDTSDQKAKDADNIAKAGAIIAVGGLIYKLISSRTLHEYRFIAGKANTHKPRSFLAKISPSILLNGHSVGLNFKVEI